MPEAIASRFPTRRLCKSRATLTERVPLATEGKQRDEVGHGTAERNDLLGMIDGIRRAGNGVPAH